MKKIFSFFLVVNNAAAVVFSFFFFLFFLPSFLANAQIITTIAGCSCVLPIPYGDGGPATAADVGGELSVAVDGAGNVYMGDGGHDVVRKVNTAGIISTFASGGSLSFGDGGPATDAEIAQATGLWADGSGNIYISDMTGAEVRQVNIMGIINDYAGDHTLGLGGYSGDGGPATAAKLLYPYGLAMDAAGSIYIADLLNNRVRKVDAFGTITTIAGNGTPAFYGEGIPATDAELYRPTDVAVDGAGNVYIADEYNGRVRMVNTSGIISTFAGNASYGYTGDGLAATIASLESPYGVAVDALGNVYIADGDASVVRKVNKAGIISTIVGTGTPGHIGDGGPATAAEVNRPSEVKVDCGGNLYIADLGGPLRKVTYNHAPYFTGGHAQNITVCKSSGATSTNALLAAMDIDTLQTATWSVLLFPMHGTAVAGYAATTNGSILTPTGLTYTPTTGYVGNDTFSVVVTDCGHLSDTTTVYVNVSIGPAIDTIAGPFGLCMGTPITLTEDTTGGAWGVTNAHAAITGGVVTGLSAGTDTITYSKTSACGTTTIMHPVTVSNTPVAGSISGPGLVCIGLPTTLTDPATGGVWSASNTDATVAGGIVNGVAAGTDIISYTVTNYCGTANTATTLTVSPMPDAGTITGAGSVCVGATTSLSDAASGGAWNTANLDASVSGGIVTGISAGIDTISYFVSNVCGTAFATHAVTVLALPDAGVISGLSTVCVGATITLADPADGGTGAWNSSNANAGVVAGVVTGMVGGTSIISYSVSNTCGTATATFVVTMSSFLPVTAPITGTTTTFCAGTSTTLSEPTTGGSWGSSNKAAYVVGGVVAGVSGGADTISYSITNGCGSASSVYVVTINPLPDAGNVLGLDNACPGYTVTLADGVGGGTWSSSDNGIATVTDGVVRGVSAGTAFIIYTTTNACGTSSVKYPFTVLGPSDCVIYTGVTTPAGLPQGGGVSVYPNPATDELTITGVRQNTGYRLYSVTGESMQQGMLHKGSNTLSMRYIAPGVYILEMTGEDGVRNMVRVVKE